MSRLAISIPGILYSNTVQDSCAQIFPISRNHFKILLARKVTGDNVLTQLVEAQRYKLEDRGFDSRWNHWAFSSI